MPSPRTAARRRPDAAADGAGRLDIASQQLRSRDIPRHLGRHLTKEQELVKKVLAAGLAVLALGAPAVAAADPAIGGFLSVKAAIRFQKKYFPPVAPTSLLRDNRATFFKTKRPISVRSCRRVNRATVICRFSLIMTPNAAHRRAHWFPISCRGTVRSRHRVDNSIIGDVRGYKCKTVSTTSAMEAA